MNIKGFICQHNDIGYPESAQDSLKEERGHDPLNSRDSKYTRAADVLGTSEF